MGSTIAFSPFSTLVIPSNAEAVNSRKQYLLTNQVFDNKYNPIPHADENIAKELYPSTLQDLVNQEIIVSDIKDISLALGTRYGRKDVNFYRGMQDMWNAKRGINIKRELQKKRDNFLDKMRNVRTKSSLRGYRDRQITHGVRETLQELHNNRGIEYQDWVRIFMRNVVGTISPNVLLGYNIQELLPPGIDGKQINPVFKAYFLDKLLKEAGEVFIEGYPARYDSMMSFGPFQMTNIAMPIISQMNPYVGIKNRVPRYVQEFDGLQHHVSAAVMFAYSNWEILGKILGKKGLLKKFVYAFEKLGERERQITIAGLTACMHHLPGTTLKRISWYVDKGDLRNMHYGIREASLTKQLRKYYDSAAEAYLLMKVFHNLNDSYSKR